MSNRDDSNRGPNLMDDPEYNKIPDDECTMVSIYDNDYDLCVVMKDQSYHVSWRDGDGTASRIGFMCDRPVKFCRNGCTTGPGA